MPHNFDTVSVSRPNDTITHSGIRGRLAVLAYAVLVYLIFQATFVALVIFTSGLFPSLSVDGPAVLPTPLALAVDIGLLALFGVQHSVMARASFKARLHARLSRAAGRATYVLATCLVLLPLFVLWQPIPGIVWAARDPFAVAVLWSVFAAGWLLIVWSTFAIDHWDLFGLRQAWLYARGRPYTPVPFRDPLLYKVVRHPMMVGVLLAVWAIPTMTASHLLFAAGFTVYVVIGTAFEERDLLETLGDQYADYRRRVPWLPLPPLPPWRS